MVTRVEGPGARSTRFVLQPNHSLRWGTAKAVFAAMCGCSGAIAAFFGVLGAWPVLPFVGLEMLVLAAALYVSARWAAHREVVTITEREIVIERGYRRKTDEQRLPRPWSQVLLLRDARGWYPSRLVIRSPGREVEVGRRLCEPERAALARSLAAVRASDENNCRSARPTAG